MSAEWEKASAELRRPFTAAAVKMKPQSVTKDQLKGLVSYYIDARLAAERLSAAVGADGWTEEYQVISTDPQAGLPIECRLTVLGVTRADVGQIAPGPLDDKAWKSAYSDALKRAAVKFGVGAYLYNSPNNWVETRVGNNGKAQGFSETGARAARELYAKWIGTKPVKDLYGAPLDHGDVETTPEPEAGVESSSGHVTGGTAGPLTHSQTANGAPKLPSKQDEEKLLALIAEKDGDVEAATAAMATARSTEDYAAWFAFQKTHWQNQPKPFKAPARVKS
jgi:hypothetical protein